MHAGPQLGEPPKWPQPERILHAQCGQLLQTLAKSVQRQVIRQQTVQRTQVPGPHLGQGGGQTHRDRRRQAQGQRIAEVLYLYLASEFAEHVAQIRGRYLQQQGVYDGTWIRLQNERVCEFPRLDDGGAAAVDGNVCPIDRIRVLKWNTLIGSTARRVSPGHLGTWAASTVRVME